MSTKPPFDLNDEMVNIIAEITEKIGRLEESQRLENNLHLRKENRIKTIRSTTAIENNSLSLRQVKDVLNGKSVVGKTSEIQEVKNAFTAYENLSTFKPYDIYSFLNAHTLIAKSLVPSVGNFRDSDVGVIDGADVIHIGARPKYIHSLVSDLFRWAESTSTHPLIVSAVVHYELEYIHPFEDANGRMGRLWQTVILYNWKNIFEYIPIETIVYKHQSDYYDAIAESREEIKSNKFIMFMLKAIDEALDELDNLEITDMIANIVADKLSLTEKIVLFPIIKYLLKNETIENSNVRVITDKSAESTKKYLNKFVELDALIPIGENKGRKYKLNKSILKN